MATVDAYVDYDYLVMPNVRMFGHGLLGHILREASALLVQLQWAIPEPPFVERATDTALTLFFV